MRVIAGKYRSRRLHTLHGLALRPSSDRLRQTLFDILATQVEDAVFLDLFAGSGAVAIEALSRGARHAIFVENHPAGAAILRRNLTSLAIPIHENVRGNSRASSAGKPALGAKSVPTASLETPSGLSASSVSAEFSGTAEILTHSATAAIEQLVSRGTRVDLAFVDPPYADSDAYDSVLDLLGNSDLLTHSGMVILEHHHKRQFPALVEQLERARIVKQGDSALSFYRVVLAA